MDEILETYLHLEKQNKRQRSPVYKPRLAGKLPTCNSSRVRIYDTNLQLLFLIAIEN